MSHDSRKEREINLEKARLIEEAKYNRLYQDQLKDLQTAGKNAPDLLKEAKGKIALDGDQDLIVDLDEMLGKKFDNGKPMVSLIPAEFIIGTAQVFTFGAKKYGNHNFRKGLAHSRCLDAALRHILAILQGETTDLESGLPHRYHAACCLAMYDYMVNHHEQLNDLAEKESK